MDPARQSRNQMNCRKEAQRSAKTETTDEKLSCTVVRMNTNSSPEKDNWTIALALTGRFRVTAPRRTIHEATDQKQFGTKLATPRPRCMAILSSTSVQATARPQLRVGHSGNGKTTRRHRKSLPELGMGFLG